MAGLMSPKVVPPDSKSHVFAYNALEALQMVWDASAKDKATETNIDYIINHVSQNKSIYFISQNKSDPLASLNGYN